MLELRQQCQVNGEYANHQHRCKISKATDLLFLLACEAENKSGWKLLLKLIQLWHSRCDDFGREMSLGGPALQR